MRVRSLDVFRGLTMAGMVIVNNPGDWSTVYWPLLHAEWHGWTPTDLIFPFFLFIVGAAIPLGSRAGQSLAARAAADGGHHRRRAGFWRRFRIFRLATIRIPGVLPRIGLCYLAAGLDRALCRRGRPPPAATLDRSRRRAAAWATGSC